MVNINISIKQEAYKFLKTLKTKNKSFSDVILSFKSEDDSIMRFFGVLKDKDWEETDQARKELRDSWDERLK
ncbi:hypothetical protein CL622_04300 [archaeon]|nr:hypothetical protein [archaeon]|tara:strand:+ start:618 stop:833 length:216 start_codon:yes stop_codon:yes gene_type:complete